MKSRVAAILVSGVLLITALLSGPASAQAAPNPQGVIGAVICLVRAVPILPPAPCPRNTDG
jgi:hypothetical protein